MQLWFVVNLDDLDKMEIAPAIEMRTCLYGNEDKDAEIKALVDSSADLIEINDSEVRCR